MPGNIDLGGRPVVRNADGSISTLRSISIGTEQGEVLIPTIVNGRAVSDDEAIAEYRRSGRHLGIFRTPEDATAYGRHISEQQGQRYNRSGFRDYRSSAYEPIEARFEQQYSLPRGLLGRIRTRGERSNADEVSPAGARTVYQFTPQTRALFIRRHRIDPWASPENAARAAALHLRESFDRTGSWEQAITEYHGGTNRRSWGPRTRDYYRRVLAP